MPANHMEENSLAGCPSSVRGISDPPDGGVQSGRNWFRTVVIGLIVMLILSVTINACILYITYPVFQAIDLAKVRRVGLELTTTKLYTTKLKMDCYGATDEKTHDLTQRYLKSNRLDLIQDLVKKHKVEHYKAGTSVRVDKAYLVNRKAVIRLVGRGGYGEWIPFDALSN